MFTGKDGERIINTGLANIRDTQRKLATYCGFELAIYRIISPDIFFLTERNQCTVTVWDWMKDWMMLLFFFSYEVTSSEWCCPLQRLSYLFGCIYNTTGKTIRCDCRSGNNKYKCWPAGSQVKKLIFYYSLWNPTQTMFIIILFAKKMKRE